MAKRKNATPTMTEDELQLWAALEHVGSAEIYMQAARAAFGEDEGERSDVIAVARCVLAAKDCISKGTEALGSLTWDCVDAADREATELQTHLYDTFDVLVLVSVALKARKLPDGEGITICPVAGALSAALERMPRAVETIRSLVLAEKVRTQRKAA